ncbi:epoxide hydrolase N-terminal domain-containing protein [Rhodococcus sp. NPDC059968]|uniref:epoxide hydrolase N-terminal domain-containing protein n=1 Tax=Rhodococcus sp. NPDC059968 TaxID=3347017 RepID=UPI0036735E2F
MCAHDCATLARATTSPTNPGTTASRNRGCKVWSDEFDWRAEEAQIDMYRHCKAEIDGTPIDYLHVRGKGPNPKSSHGWPWTFWDWKEVVDPTRVSMLLR